MAGLGSKRVHAQAALDEAHRRLPRPRADLERAVTRAQTAEAR